MVAHMLRKVAGWPARSHYPMLAAAFLLGNLIAVIYSVMQPSSTFPLRQHYTYQETVASNGVKLYSIQTVPDNIVLKPITSNVSVTPDFGINGGFFWNGDLLSIAVINDQPLKGEQDDYGSGWYNIDYPKGTLIWDEITRQFSVQVVQDAHQIKVTDRQHYWAQGGVSMSLGHDDQWVHQALAEDMPAFDEPRLRSGAVYDDRQNLWLIVTDKPCTVEQFRTAIVEKIGKHRLVDGIFLDGDGSSQMNTAQKVLKGDSREVYQMLALKRK
ncbi:hypothetical protein GCM10023310_67040 [Paenibacillus vulneris]|uniref:Phosphodiester glycosidase domain-containing protein n=1 Tax=Paenibacillus vulneris TaxID=1133364 RepID=A0ABW3UHD0_9BACL|nr:MULTISPECIES: hypothetical protein [unclassified Paenibacillus]MBE1441998.1 hypothetical protein [Paenibacillus sp. OAS669]